MRTVETEDGRRYLLLKRSSESSLVRDPETGEERYLPNDRLTPAGTPPLETAAGAVSGAVRRIVTGVHDERTLGLLLEIDERGPLAVGALLDGYELCESDLHGRLGELRAAGLVEETRAAGGRGYRTTDTASEGLRLLREADRADLR